MSVDQRCVGPRSALSAEFEEMGAIIRKGFRIEFDLDADHRSCFDLIDEGRQVIVRTAGIGLTFDIHSWGIRPCPPCIPAGSDV
jgi:hypothetical protein